MAERIKRGEIWLFGFSRPAPITATIRGAPSEVIIGVDEGLKKDSAVNLGHVQTVEKSRLKRFVGTAGAQKMNAVCRALGVAAGCGT